MKIKLIVSAIAAISATTIIGWNPAIAAATSGGTNISSSNTIKIEDPYAQDQSNSPWTRSMDQVTTFGGRVSRGDSSILLGKNFNGFDSYAPFMKDKTQALGGYGSTNVGIGCDGINLGGVVDGQMSQYQSMVEAFIQNAPTLAIMFLAYSQPTVKSVIDQMNGVGQFGLDLTNMSCSGVRAIADKAAEEKAQSMAEARCTAEAGYKDPECMSDDGLMGGVANVLKDTKKTVSERSGAFLGKVSSSTGGLVKFHAGLNGNSVTSSTKSVNGGSTSISSNTVNRSEACTNIDTGGLRTLLLAASGIPCSDIENYSPLLPDYQISEEGESGVIPRTMTLRKLASDLVVKYDGWINEVMGAPEDQYVNTDGFKAIYNRTSVSITKLQHRKINVLMQQNPAQGLAMMRNLSQLIALKDLTSIVNNLEVAVLTGMQNQPDDQVLSELRRKQYINAISTLKTELYNLTEEINLDLKRNEVIKTF